MADVTIAEAMEQFLSDAMVGAEHTRRTYRTALRALGKYLAEQNLPPDTTPISRLDVARTLQWSNWLRAPRPNLPDGVNRRTLHTYLAALSRFIHFLQVRQLGSLSVNDLTRFREELRLLRRNQALPQLLPHPPTPEQLELLRKAAREQSAPPNDPRAELRRLRDIALLEMLRSSGMRVGELVSLKRRQLQREDRSAWVIGKGGKERQVFFDGDAWRALEAYLALRQAHDAAAGRALADLPVIARHDKKAGHQMLPLSTEAVERALRHLTKASGLEAEGITPHALRHYFATRIYQTTRDLAVTQTALGHSNPTTTRIYAKLEDDAVRLAHEAAFARRTPTG